jgi:hypothetical protein
MGTVYADGVAQCYRPWVLEEVNVLGSLQLGLACC